MQKVLWTLVLGAWKTSLIWFKITFQKYQKKSIICNRKFHHNWFWSNTHSLKSVTSIILWFSLFLLSLLFSLFLYLTNSRKGALSLVCSDSSLLNFIINPIWLCNCIVGSDLWISAKEIYKISIFACIVQ